MKFLNLIKNILCRVLLLIIYFLPAFIITFLNLEFIATFFEIHTSIKKSDAIVVLGAGSVNNTVSSITAERLLWGWTLYKNKIADKIILSGGKADKETGKKSEAEIMKEFLIKYLLANENDLILEKNSYNTYTNFLEVEKILRKKRFKRVILVTTPPHSLRAYLTFKKSNSIIYNSIVPYSKFEFGKKKVKLKFLIYEIAGIIWYKIKYKI